VILHLAGYCWLRMIPGTDLVRHALRASAELDFEVVCATTLTELRTNAFDRLLELTLIDSAGLDMDHAAWFREWNAMIRQQMDRA